MYFICCFVLYFADLVDVSSYNVNHILYSQKPLHTSYKNGCHAKIGLAISFKLYFCFRGQNNCPTYSTSLKEEILKTSDCKLKNSSSVPRTVAAAAAKCFMEEKH